MRHLTVTPEWDQIAFQGVSICAKVIFISWQKIPILSFFQLFNIFRDNHQVPCMVLNALQGGNIITYYISVNTHYKLQVSTIIIWIL